MTPRAEIQDKLEKHPNQYKLEQGYIWQYPHAHTGDCKQKVLPKLWQDLCNYFHKHPQAEHPGAAKTLKELTISYTWDGVTKFVHGERLLTRSLPRLKDWEWNAEPSELPGADQIYQHCLKWIEKACKVQQQYDTQKYGMQGSQKISNLYAGNTVLLCSHS
ncbi:hypothetical protein PR048_004566 [Dryococelus australis]|uniref:Integrase zinc-binding domain-containing protein n=1 Tax=Dryococelus australis TaxID=614101 RepID=A0ABQ9I5T0_9NEOP|nr:hypothetical protein PR048_004566 [Dryococelus australis]